MVHSYSLPALPIMIQVQVASERPIYLSKELLCSRSHYFSRALEGDFEESRSYTVLIPWNSHATSCVLFLSWLGSMDLTGDEFSNECLLLFLYCCSYFQVSEEHWTFVVQRVTLPTTYAGLSTDMKSIWTRHQLSFSIMQKVVEKSSDLIASIEYIFAWFDEESATNEREKRELERSEDFFNMREAVLMQFQRKMKMGVFLSTREFISVAGLQSLTCRYPVAANCIPFDWFIGKMRQGSFTF